MKKQWTAAQRKAQSKKLKAAWAKRKAEATESSSNWYGQVVHPDIASGKCSAKPIDYLPKPDAPVNPTYDLINHPPHYTFGKYEVIDVLSDWFSTNPLLWQVGKYIARADHKGAAIADLKKAKFYLEREIARLEK